MTSETADRLEPFEGADGEWYWRRVAANNRSIAVGGEGFTRREDALRAGYRANVDLDPNQDPEVFGAPPA